MLPPGLSTHPVDRTEQHRVHPLHPHARTVVHLVVGACACFCGQKSTVPLPFHVTT